MAFPWLAVAAGSKVIGALFGGSAANKAAGQAQDLAKANVSYISQEAVEQKRRLRFEQERTMGTAKAGVAASGFRSGKESMGASQRSYLDTLADVQKKELDWITRSATSRSNIAKRAGDSAASQLRSQGTAQLFSGLSSAASTMYQWGNN